MKKTALIIIIIFFNSCFPSFEPEKLYIKVIETADISLKWYTYSTAYSEYPEYLISVKNNNIDTICISTNIADIKLENEKIILEFYGSPEKNASSISIPKITNNTEIEIDTNFVLKKPIVREFFKIKQCSE